MRYFVFFYIAHCTNKDQYIGRYTVRSTVFPSFVAIENYIRNAIEGQEPYAVAITGFNEFLNEQDFLDAQTKEDEH